MLIIRTKGKGVRFRHLCHSRPICPLPSCMKEAILIELRPKLRIGIYAADVRISWEPANGHSIKYVITFSKFLTIPPSKESTESNLSWLLIHSLLKTCQHFFLYLSIITFSSIFDPFPLKSADVLYRRPQMRPPGWPRRLVWPKCRRIRSGGLLTLNGAKCQFYWNSFVYRSSSLMPFLALQNSYGYACSNTTRVTSTQWYNGAQSWNYAEKSAAAMLLIIWMYAILKETKI